MKSFLYKKKISWFKRKQTEKINKQFKEFYKNIAQKKLK